MKIKYLLIILILISQFIFPKKIDYAHLRKNMVEKQILERGITDKRILNAFYKIKRHLFVKPELRHMAYGDYPLPIDENQTISQPYIVAIMTYIIAPEYNKKILEIGTGSGYQASILAQLVKNVYTIEIKKNLALKAKKLIQSFGYKNIKFKIGDGYLGWKEYAPYDGIIVTCSPDHIPPPLIEQLAVGGRMVIPVSYTSNVQELILIEKDAKGNLKRTNLIPVRFVPLIRNINGK
jgi:protein-L-isoaspartate(D-aspartate) O-methyltransferase